MKTVLFVGNFDSPSSTESHHVWTWTRLGYNVIKLQENRTSADEILETCTKADVFQWTHTHDFDFPGCSTDLIKEIKNLNIPSFSYHLDRYWGIKNRQNNYLEHPSFHLDYFFSTDGGNEEKWKEAGINHRWILPGVVEYGCFFGLQRDASWDIPIVFTGSVDYHYEYPFRPKMIKTIQNRYGHIFQVKQGVREKDLNNLYARAKVVIGDHIFAGEPRYCSDRLPESAGRGAFIIYPATEGITEEWEQYGLVTYKPQDIADLTDKIDYYLNPAHEQERVLRRNKLQDYVQKNHTYTHRLKEILKTMKIE